MLILTTMENQIFNKNLEEEEAFITQELLIRGVVLQATTLLIMLETFSHLMKLDTLLEVDRINIQGTNPANLSHNQLSISKLNQSFSNNTVVEEDLRISNLGVWNQTMHITQNLKAKEEAMHIHQPQSMRAKCSITLLKCPWVVHQILLTTSNQLLQQVLPIQSNQEAKTPPIIEEAICQAIMAMSRT